MSVIYIALNNLQLRFKDKKVAFWMIALPVVFTLITGMATSGNVNSTSIPVAVCDEDDSLYSQYIVEAIGVDQDFHLTYVDLQEGKELVERNEVAGFIHIPLGLGSATEGGGQSDIYFFPADRQFSPLKMEKIMEKAISELNNSLAVSGVVWQVFNPQINPSLLTEEVLREYNDIPISVNFRWSTSEEIEKIIIPTGMNQSSPGMAVMFTLMTVVMSGASTILLQRERGTLARLLTTPNAKWTIVAGNTLGIFILGLAQMLIMILIGQFFLGVNWGNDMLATILLTLAFVFSATGVAMALAAISKNANQIAVIGNLVIIVISMLGGAYWPINMMSPNMQLVSKMVPTGWAISGYTDVIIRGMSLGDMWLNVVVLLSFGIVLTTFGIYRLKLE